MSQSNLLWLTGPSSPHDNWRSGILQRAGWGWLCNARSALWDCRMSDSLLIWRTVHHDSGWWQNGGTCRGPFGGNAWPVRWIRKAVKKHLNNVQQTRFVSLVGQDVADGFITEANEKTAQSFISQQIFRVPAAESDTEPIKQPYRQITFKNNTAMLWNLCPTRISLLFTLTHHSEKTKIDRLRPANLLVVANGSC